MDDGSLDRTAQIIASYSKQYEWIKLVSTSRDAKRQPGAGVINAFNRGYESIKGGNHDFIVKLDCDLRFDKDYFKKIIAHFTRDDRLGIASGVYLENRTGSWVPVKMPLYHAAGACKVVRRKCFEQIGGFIPNRGWDTVDEIKAQAAGWKTRHFAHLHFYHLKNEGSGIGWRRTNEMLGEIFYRTGGSKLFFILKVTHKMLIGKPFMLSGLMMLYGFMRQLVRRNTLLVSKDEARFYKRLLNRRIFSRFRREAELL